MIIGNLGQAPEVRQTQNNTKVVNLSVATNRRWKSRDGERQEETTWHRVVVWGEAAGFVERLDKGAKVFVEGRIQTRKWQDKEGNNRETTEINAFRVTGLSGGEDQAKKDNSPDKPSAAPQQAPTQAAPEQAPTKRQPASSPQPTQKQGPARDVNEDSSPGDDLPF